MSESSPPTGHVLITRKASFCASHRYANPNWTDEKNREVFGACFNPYGHGHNYELEVSVSGEISTETGMVLNLKTVDKIIKTEIIQRFDHRFINKEVEGFDRLVPTCENLVIQMWKWLAPRFEEENCKLHRLKLYECPTIYAEYSG